MWFFRSAAQRRRFEDIEAKVAAHERVLDLARAKLDRMGADIATVEQKLDELGDIGLEWESMYNKFRTLYARLNKRAEREEGNGKEAAATGPMNPLAQRLLDQAGGNVR